MSADPSELLALATALAEDAGRLLLDGLGRALTDVETKSSGTDMVTEIDRASERLIADGLHAARPDDGILGEEGSAREGSSGVRWVVDPLDGTTNYLYGHPVFAVSIAAEVGGVPTVGVVCMPALRELFSAVRGRGATCNGRPVRVSGHDELGTALIATGFSYVAGRRARQAGLLTDVLPRVRDIRRDGAAAVDLCWVACGRVDAFYEAGLQPWDAAAGALIAAEAGAVVHTDGDLLIASTPAIADPLRALVTAR
jgi:myo-inositol-1(or 4)-monophosphatase